MSRPTTDLILLGATGSIGRSTCDLVRRFGDRFRVVAASAHRRTAELAQLARDLDVARLWVTDPEAEALPADVADRAVQGDEAFAQILAGAPGALVVNGMVGAAGLAPTIQALERGHDVALANKEALVVGGELVLDAAKRGGARLIPVDSEHSAIAQCLRGNPAEEVRKLWLTASGGSFRDRDPATLADVTLEEVLSHPTWDMGPKITVDCATMMNKGLEVVEAHFLFGIELARIDVVIHRQSIIHSMVEMRDGAFLAQMGAPDMRIPILYALAGEAHLATDVAPFDPLQTPQLTFEPVDPARYPCFVLARKAAAAGGAGTIVLNAANEEAVAGLLANRLSFPQIPQVIETMLETIPLDPVGSVEEALDRDAQTRQKTQELVSRNARTISR